MSGHRTSHSPLLQLPMPPLNSQTVVDGRTKHLLFRHARHVPGQFSSLHCRHGQGPGTLTSMYCFWEHVGNACMLAHVYVLCCSCSPVWISHQQYAARRRLAAAPELTLAYLFPVLGVATTIATATAFVLVLARVGGCVANLAARAVAVLVAGVHIALAPPWLRALAQEQAVGVAGAQFATGRIPGSGRVIGACHVQLGAALTLGQRSACALAVGAKLPAEALPFLQPAPTGMRHTRCGVKVSYVACKPGG